MLARLAVVVPLLGLALWGAGARTNSCTAVSVVALALIAFALVRSPRLEGMSSELAEPDAAEIQRINKHNMDVLNADLEPLIELHSTVRDLSANAVRNRDDIKAIGDRAEHGSAELVGKPTPEEEAALDPR